MRTRPAAGFGIKHILVALVALSLLVSIPGISTAAAKRTAAWQAAMASISSRKKPVTISVTSPRNRQMVTGTIKWQTSISGATPTRVDFVVDGTVKWSAASAANVYAGTGLLDTTKLSNGSHTLKAVAYVAATSASASVTVNVSNKIAAPPPTTTTPTTTTPTTTTLTTTTPTTTTPTTTTPTTTTPTTTTPTTTPPPALGSKLPTRLPQSSGSTLYVAPTGSDSNSCSISLPCLSIARALSLASSGTMIYVRGGTYKGMQEIRDRQFSSSNPVTIRNYPSEAPVFSGDSSSSAYGYPAIFIFNVKAVRLSGVTVSNANGNGVKVENSSDVELESLDVHGNGVQGVLVDGIAYGSTQPYSQNIQLWNSVFHDNGGKFPGNETYAIKGDHAVYWGGAPNTPDGTQHGAIGGVIANNLIYDQPTGRGIQLGQSAWGTIVVNNTINHAYSSSPYAANGIEIWNDGSDNYASRNLVVENNIVANCLQLAAGGSASVDMPSNLVDYNLGWNNAAGGFVGTDSGFVLFTNGLHNIHGDPLFANAATHDFRLAAGSAAAGKGDPDYTPPNDIQGVTRSGADVGAYTGK